MTTTMQPHAGESHSGAHPKGKAAPTAPRLGVLVAVTSLGPLALNMIVPAMPELQRVFNANYGIVQLALTLFLFTNAVTPLVGGPLSDRFGRRAVLLSGIIIFQAGTLVAALAPDIWTLLLGRIGQAIGGSIGLAIARAVIIDVYKGDKAGSMMGYVLAMMVIMPMLGTPLGGFLVDYVHWRSIMLVLLIAGAFIWFIAYRGLFETNPVARPIPSIGSMLEDYRLLLFGTPDFRRYAIIAALTLSTFFAFLAGAPYVMETLFGLSPSAYGLYFALMSLAHIAGNFSSGRFAVAVGGNRMMWLGLTSCLVGVSWLVTLSALGFLTPFSMFAGMVFISLGNGLTMPNAAAAAVAAAPGMAGTASGLASAVQLSLAALATIVVGAAQSGAETALPTVSVMASLVLAAVITHTLGQLARQRLRVADAAAE